MKPGIFHAARYGVLLLTLACGGCGLLNLRGEAGGEPSLKSAEADIVKSFSIEDVAAREKLLADINARIRRAEAECGARKQCPAELYTTGAFYNIATGNTAEAKKLNARAVEMNAPGPIPPVIGARILLREKGKPGTAEAMELLRKADALAPGFPFAGLTRGDWLFLNGNYAEARKHYMQVLKSGMGFQVDASDRLETIFQIESLGINTGAMQDVILSRGIQRDDAADLLDRVFQVDRLASGKSPAAGRAPLPDVDESVHAASIKKLLALGLFSFTGGEGFSPFSVMRRREMAKLLEDCIVLATGNVGFRSKYGKNDRSPFTDVGSDDPYFNAIMLADEFNLMDPSLGGAFGPLQAVKGLDAMIIFQKLSQRFRR